MSLVDTIHQPRGEYLPLCAEEDIREERFDLDEYLYTEWDKSRSGKSLKNQVRYRVLSSIIQIRSKFRE